MPKALRPAVDKAAWAVLLLAALLLFVRAGHRLTQPEIWAEDADNLWAWEGLGIASLVEPLNGYLILVTRLITTASASLSIYYYPWISAVLAWAVSLLVFLAVARSPLVLKGGALLGFACLLVPMGPEVFGLPLHSFWWTSLLLFVAVLWDPEAQRAGWARALCVALAALSSPVVVAVLPLLLLRAWLFRGRPAEAGVAAVASLGAAVQLYFMWQAGQAGQGVALAAGGGGAGIRFELDTAVEVVRKFLGIYLVGNLKPKAIGTFGFLLLAVCAAAAWRHRRSPVIWALGYLWAAAVAMAAVRVDIGTLHQVLAGARYFFYPFILLSWFLLHVFLVEESRWLRGAIAACLLLSVANAVPVLRNTHGELNYQARLEECSRASGEFTLHAHSDGYAPHAWSRKTTGAKCAQLLQADWLYQWLRKR